ncbi:Chaperone protein HtpG [Streptomyces fumanus]
MRRRLTKKVLSTVKDLMTKDQDRYATFWREFGTAVKEGLVTDPENRDAILAVASFASTRHESELTTLKDYVARMKEGQEDIDHLAGESRQAIENSPPWRRSGPGAAGAPAHRRRRRGGADAVGGRRHAAAVRRQGAGSARTPGCG